jgi:hypothetical protein
MRVHIEHADLAPVSQIIGSRVNPHRIPERAQPGFDRGDFRGHLFDGLAAR